MKVTAFWVIIAICSFASATGSFARSPYDGSWDLVFVTQTGTCDASYNFTVNISEGIVTHPNLAKFRGRVSKSGSVRAAVTVHEKSASGAGKLSAKRVVADGTATPAHHDVQATGRLSETDHASPEPRVIEGTCPPSMFDLESSARLHAAARHGTESERPRSALSLTGLGSARDGRSELGGALPAFGPER